MRSPVLLAVIGEWLVARVQSSKPKSFGFLKTQSFAMTQKFLQRYLRTLNQNKWLGLATFAACVGVSGAIALQPWSPQTYKAEGTLLYDTPLTFSNTGAKLQEQGKQVSEEMLLSDNVIRLAAKQAKVEPQQIAQNADIQMPQPNGSQAIHVFYIDSDRDRAASTLNALMQEMVKDSHYTNKTRLKTIIASIHKRLPREEFQLRAVERQIEQFNRVVDKNSPSYITQQTRLEQELKIFQDVLYKSRTALADAQLADAEPASGLTIIKAPQVTAQSRFNKSVLPLLAMGVFGGLGVSMGLIPLLALMTQQPSRLSFDEN